MWTFLLTRALQAYDLSRIIDCWIWRYIISLSTHVSLCIFVHPQNIVAYFPCPTFVRLLRRFSSCRQGKTWVAYKWFCPFVEGFSGLVHGEPAGLLMSSLHCRLSSPCKIECVFAFWAYNGLFCFCFFSAWSRMYFLTYPDFCFCFFFLSVCIKLIVFA